MAGISTSGGAAGIDIPVAAWQAWPLGNGWADYSVTTDNTFPSPQYARVGSIVFIRGALNGASATGTLGALPADCRPIKKQRLFASTPGGTLALEMRNDGILRDTAGGNLATTAFIILQGCYPVT
jgi:hypothetical protein